MAPATIDLGSGSDDDDDLRDHRARITTGLLSDYGLDALLLTMFDSVRWVSEMPQCDYSEQLHDAFAAVASPNGQVELLSMYADQMADPLRDPVPSLPRIQTLGALPACYSAGVSPSGTAAAILPLLPAGRGRLGIDELDVTAARLISVALPELELVPVAHAFQVRRAVKHPREIALLCEGAALLDAAVRAALEQLANGGSERDAGAALAAEGYARGVEGISHISVATPDAADSGLYPFGYPYLTDSRLQPGQTAMIDAGFYTLGGYASDIARTVVRGRARPRLQSAYEALLDAYDRSAAGLLAGTTVSEIWSAACAELERLGYAPYGKLIGHGIGLRVTEAPMITGPRRLAEDTALRPGMTIALEFHVHRDGMPLSFEDVWLVTDSAPRSITGATRSLMLG